MTVNERSAPVNRYFGLKGVFSRQHIAAPSTKPQLSETGQHISIQTSESLVNWSFIL